jgi:hypothetical protein
VTGRESDHPPSYAAEVKNAQSSITTAPYVFVILWLVKHSDICAYEDCIRQGLTHGINPRRQQSS